MASVNIPSSSTAVTVSIIDTTSWAYDIPCENLFSPKFRGLEKFSFCSFAFLVTHTAGSTTRHILFDLGIRQDTMNMVPDMVQKLQDWGSTVKVEKDTADILADQGFDLDEVEAIPRTLGSYRKSIQIPPGVKLLVGPDISERYVPGWPANLAAEFNEADIEGRVVQEISQDMFNVLVGDMSAYDYFGDGSFHLLDAPGHSLGHLNALARTTVSPATFILMGADSVHLGGELRPSEELPLPSFVNEPGLKPRSCPQEALLKFHPRRSSKVPYLGLDPCFPEDLVAAEKTIRLLQKFDSDDQVLIVFAHDTTIFHAADFYPLEANQWYEKGWKQKTRWAFLPDLQKRAASPSRNAEEISN